MTRISFVLISIILSIPQQAESAKKGKSLFNGKDLSGWHSDVPEMDNNKEVASPFIVRNDFMVSMSTPGGHLITNKIYRDLYLSEAG